MRNSIRIFIENIIIENNMGARYYRAVTEYLGNETIFVPKNFYEAFDDEGMPLMKYDSFQRSEQAEISASKSVGGALLGLWSMLMNYGQIQNNKKIYFYSINEKPQKDLSNIRIDDFEYIKEVRYNKNVTGKYIGYYVLDKYFNDNTQNFYERLNSDPWDEFTDEQIEMWDNFEAYILKLNESNLKYK